MSFQVKGIWNYAKESRGDEDPMHLIFQIPEFLFVCYSGIAKLYSITCVMLIVINTYNDLKTG